MLAQHHAWALAVIVAAAFAGAFIKGVSTLGLALFAIPLISLFLDVQTAILSVFLSKFLSDIAMLFHSKKVLPWRLSWRVAGFVLAGLASIPLATFFLAAAKGRWLYVCLAASILFFVAFQLKPRDASRTKNGGWRRDSVFGFAAGASQGLTGAAGPYAAMYLYGLGLTTEEFVFLSSVIYLLFDFSQLGSILYTDLYDARRMFYALVTIVPVMAGTYLGMWFRAKLDDRQFKRLVLVLLLISAGALMFRAAAT